jgi:hypothetical protein
MDPKHAAHDKKLPANTPPPPAPANGKPATAATPSADAPKRKTAPRKVYICTGEVTELDSISEAEKYVNDDSTRPKGEYTVIKGFQTPKKQQVSLR